MDLKPMSSPTWHAMDNVSRSTGFCMKSTQKGGSNAKLGDHDSSKLHNP